MSRILQVKGLGSSELNNTTKAIYIGNTRGKLSVNDKTRGLGLHDEKQEFQVFIMTFYYLFFKKEKVKVSLTNVEEMLSDMFKKQWRFSTVREIICYRDLTADLSRCRVCLSIVDLSKDL